MSERNSILRNILFSGITSSSNIFFFVLLLLAARHLGDVEYGRFSLAFALPAIFEFLVGFGLGQMVVREVARDRSLASKYLSNTLFLMICLSLITFLIIASVVNLLHLPDEIKVVVYLLTLAMISKHLALLLRRFFHSFEVFHMETLTTLVERVTLLIAGALTLIGGYGIITFCLIFPLVRLSNLFFTLVVLSKKIVRPALRFDFEFSKELLRRSFPFALIVAAYALYFSVDTVMLSVMRGDQEVGWYNSSYRFVQGLILFPNIISSVLFPRLSVLYLSSRESFLALFQNGCRYILALAFPITIIGAILSKKIVLLLYGDQYLITTISLRIMLIGTGFMFLWHIFQMMFAAINHQAFFAKSMLVSVVFNMLLNLVMITKYGFLGASISTVITQLLLFSVTLVHLRQNGFRFNLFRNSVKPLIASLITGGVSIILWDIPTVLLVLFLCLLYLSLLFALRFWDREELLQLKCCSKKLLVTLKTL